MCKECKDDDDEEGFLNAPLRTIICKISIEVQTELKMVLNEFNLTEVKKSLPFYYSVNLFKQAENEKIKHYTRIFSQ